MKNLLFTLLVLLLLPTLSFAGSTVNGAGASFPYPVYSAWAFQYQKDTGTKIKGLSWITSSCVL